MILLFSVLGGFLFTLLLELFHSPIHQALFGGIVIMFSGYILSVAVESAQKDISRSLATIFLAMLAVLPEYAVDIYLAYSGGKNIEYVHYATANMTGANRMLLGLFWPITAFVSIYLSRVKSFKKWIELGKGIKLELFFLFLATLYSFKIPIMARVDLLDAFVLISLFFLYAYVSSKSEEREEHFEGIVESITRLPKVLRITIVSSLFAIAGIYIFRSVEPFTHGLIETGKLLGISEFFLIQWLAPIASEFPELVVCIMLALKGKSTTAIGALVSSKVNQWTLLVGMLPLAYSIGLGSLSSMPLDAIQREEIFLTSAQSLFGTILIADLRFNRSDALWLFVLFTIQFFIPIPQVRLFLSLVYIILSAFILIADRARVYKLVEFYKNLIP